MPKSVSFVGANHNDLVGATTLIILAGGKEVTSHLNPSNQTYDYLITSNGDTQVAFSVDYGEHLLKVHHVVRTLQIKPRTLVRIKKLYSSNGFAIV
jgi:hypothetical protein